MQSGSIISSFLRNKWVKIIFAVDIIAIVVVVVFAIINISKTAILEFNIAPVDATISVNGVDGYTNSSYRFLPGTYEIVVSHDGFEQKVFTVDLDGDSVVVISAFLLDSDEFDFYKLKDNYNSFAKLAEIASAKNNITIDHDTSAESFIEKFEKNYSFLNYLPIIEQTPSQCGPECGVDYQYDIFRIEDGQDRSECTMTLCLYVADTRTDRGAFASSVIEKFGYNPDDFQIIYGEIERN